MFFHPNYILNYLTPEYCILKLVNAQLMSS